MKDPPPATDRVQVLVMETEQASVLSVEDDARIQALISGVLRSEGYNVLTAANGQEALDMVEAEKPSVILLDLMMPGIDGWEFLRRIRQQGSTVPVVLVSAVRDLASEARKMGATDHLAKPFDVGDLLEKVHEHAGPASD